MCIMKIRYAPMIFIDENYNFLIQQYYFDNQYRCSRIILIIIIIADIMDQ